MTKSPIGSTPSAFDETFCGLLPRLYRRAVMLVGTRQSAEDAVHEAYLKLAGRPRRLLDHPEPYAYAFATLLSVVRDAHRRDRPHLLVDDVEGPGIGPVGWDGGLERRQAELEAVWLLDRLSPRQAGVVILVDLDGYTIDQAAKIMRVHRGTAAQHRVRALEKLRDLLDEPRRARGSRREGRHEA